MTINNESNVLALRKQIRLGILAPMILFGAVSIFLLLIAVFSAASLTPNAIHRNYDSIEAAMEMREAWSALKHPSEHPTKSNLEWKAQFEKAIVFEQSNITEIGEKETADDIQQRWFNSLKVSGTVSEKEFIEMNKSIDKLISLNRQGMFQFAKEAEELRSFTLRATLAFFLVALVIAIWRMEKFASEFFLKLEKI